MSQLKTAILIPAFNAAPYFHRLLKSIQAQTIPFDEVLVYDDCSEDETAALAKQYGARVYGGEKRGPAGGRNFLLQQTEADLIHFHDADDYLSPVFLEEMLKAMNKSGGNVICNMVNVGETDLAKINVVRHPGLHICEDQMTYVLEHTVNAIVGLYWRKELLKIGGFQADMLYNEDPDLHIRLVANGSRLNYIDADLVFRVVRSESYSARNWESCITYQLMGYQNYLEDDQFAPYRSLIESQIFRMTYYAASTNLEAAGDFGVKVLDRFRIRKPTHSKPIIQALIRLLGPITLIRIRKQLTKWKAVVA